jgi:replicative DNA helicase
MPSKVNLPETKHTSNLEQQPVSMPAERSVLGALIEDDGLLAEVLEAGLRIDDFSLSEHRRVFESILMLRRRNSPVDYVLVAEQLGNRQTDYVLVASLIDGVVVHEDHVLHHVAIIRKKAKLRALLRIADWLTRVVDETADPDALIAETLGKLEALTAIQMEVADVR